MAVDATTTAALVLLAGAVVLGSALAALAMRERPETGERGEEPPNTRPPRLPLAALAHGSLGVAGLGVLLIAVQGAERGLRTGTASFGIIAAVLFGIAVLFGLLIRTRYALGHGLSGTVVAIHAGAAIAGFTILMAWVGLD